jgi:hypothetical protein
VPPLIEILNGCCDTDGAMFKAFGVTDVTPVPEIETVKVMSVPGQGSLVSDGLII